MSEESSSAPELSGLSDDDDAAEVIPSSYDVHQRHKTEQLVTPMGVTIASMEEMQFLAGAEKVNSVDHFQS